jgi:DNA-binding transcriptional MocR family regulator
MELHWTQGPTPIHRPVADRFQDVVESDGFPPSPALPSIPARADSPEINLNAVTRAIEDLRRSGYRPLRPRPAAPGRAAAVVQEHPASWRARGADGEADSMPGASKPMKEDGS